MSDENQQWGVPSAPPEGGPTPWTAADPWSAGGTPASYQPYPGQPYPGQAYPGQPKPTNGLAVASLVLGILWLSWLGSILALIFGYMARREIRQNNQSGDGLAIAGIVLGWIGVGVLALFLLMVVIGLVTSAPINA